MKKDIVNKIKKEVILFLKTDEPKEFDEIDKFIYNKFRSKEFEFDREYLRNIILSLLKNKLIADVRKNKYDRHRFISTYAGIIFLRNK